MAIKYFVEADEDLEMDVQVGPEEEIEAAPDDKANEIADPVVPEVKEEEGVQLNPVEIAKKSPETVCVGCKIENVDDKEIREFYVDARDVEKYADLNEKSFLESLNDIILANEGSGMGADNIVVVMDESTSCYTRTLEKNGAACVFVNEAVEDIEMDVQVGPDKEEESVKADPQEANPVDAVKRQYGSVVVANQGDEFFMDVEDVQKCAELNCESVIKTLNKIIDVNESFDMNTENVVLIVGESFNDFDLIDKLDESGVRLYVNEAGASVADLSGLTDISRGIIRAAKAAAGKIKGDKEATSKSIQDAIDRIDKQIARMEEELKNAESGDGKVRVKFALKSLLACLPAMIFAAAITTGTFAAGTYVQFKDAKLAKEAALAVLKGSAICGAIGAPAGAVIEYAVYEKDVKRMLNELKDSKERLEKKLAKAKEKEASK